MFYTIDLVAGQKKKLGLSGRLFVLTSTGVASSISIKLIVRGQGDRNDEEVGEAQRGFKARLLSGVFDQVEFLSAVNTTIKVIVSDNDIDFSVIDGASVLATIQGLPLPVSNDRGTPGNLLHVTGVSLTDAPATAVNNLPTVACGPAAVLVKPANVNCRKARFVNLGPDPVAIGGVGLTWATRALVLLAGDTWPEDIAGNLAWYGITNAGGAATVGVQEIAQ